MTDTWAEIAQIFDELKATRLFIQNNIVIGAIFPTVEQAETAIDLAKQIGKTFVQGKTKRSRRAIYYCDPIIETIA